MKLELNEKFNNLLINFVIQEIVKKHINDALESIGVKSKVDFLLYPEKTHELNVAELLENFHTKMSMIMEFKGIIREQEQKIVLKRDLSKCCKCYPNNKVKQRHHIDLNEVKN